MRQGYCLAGTQTEVTPAKVSSDPDTGLQRIEQTHPLWPMTLAIRQIRIIGATVVEDQRSAFNLIPLPNNVNIPIPFSPLGMGEPKILEHLQKAINYAFSTMMTWALYNAIPVEAVIKEIVAGLEVPIRNARSKWGQRIQIPQELIPPGMKIGDVIQNIPSPPLPPEFWRLLDFLTTMIDKEGNQAEVAQGNAAPGWSGEAISALQNAHSQLVRASGLSTEDWLRHMTRLKVNSIAHLMTPADCQKLCRKYPIEVWQVIHKRFKNLDPIIGVEIASASGQAKNAQTQAMLGARQAGVAIPDSMILERMGINPDEAKQGQMEMATQQAQLAATTTTTNNGNGKGENNNGRAAREQESR